MRQNQKKLISLLLLLAMLFTILPAAAFAGTENNQTATISIIADSNSTVQLFAQHDCRCSDSLRLVFAEIIKKNAAKNG